MRKPSPNSQCRLCLDGRVVSLYDQASSQSALFELPEELDRSSGESVGRFIRKELEGQKLFPKVITLVLPRKDLVMREVTLPPTVAEGPGLVHAARLKLTRSLPAGVDSPSCDFDIIDSDESQTRVLGVAVSGQRLQFYRDLVDAMAARLSAVLTRTELLAAVNQSDDEQPHLEAVVAEFRSDSEIVFRRGTTVVNAASIPPSPSGEGLVSSVQRATLSITGWQSDARVHLIVNERDDLQLPEGWQRYELPESGSPDGQKSMSVDEAVLAVELHSMPAIDLLNPTEPPDPAERRRQVMLAGAFLLIAAIGGPLVLGRQHVSAIEAEIAIAEDRLQQAQQSYVDSTVQSARLRHLDSWLETDPIPLQALGLIENTFMQAQSAESETLLLQRIRLTVEQDPRYIAGQSPVLRGSYQSSPFMSVELQGNGTTREVAESFREGLLAIEQSTVVSNGSEQAGSINLSVQTPIPLDEPAKVPGSAP